MEYSSTQLKRINYFRRSVRLDDVTTANDPAYVFSDDDLYGILEVSAPSHTGKGIEETPDNEFYFVLLLAKREIYYRLATTTAPFYPLKAEGASLDKNVRFDHYIKLVETVTKEYEKMYESKYGEDGNFGDETGTGGVVTTYNSKVAGHGYAHRYDTLSSDIPLEVSLSGITTSSVNLDWTRFDSTYGSDFLKYEVYVSEDLIYDEYSPTATKISIPPIYTIKEVRKTKIRVTDLEPDKDYFVLVRTTSRLGLQGFFQLPFKTKSNKVPNDRDVEVLVGGE